MLAVLAVFALSVHLVQVAALSPKYWPIAHAVHVSEPLEINPA